MSDNRPAKKAPSMFTIAGMYPQTPKAEEPKDDLVTYRVGTTCEVDGYEIKVMAFKNTGVCCEACRKRRDNEISESEYQALRVGHVIGG